MSIAQLWQNMTEEKKLLIKQLGILSLATYVCLQIISLLLPVSIAIFIGYSLYRWFVNQNPKVLR